MSRQLININYCYHMLVIFATSGVAKCDKCVGKHIFNLDRSV